MVVPLYKAYGELYIYIAKNFISEHDSHKLEGWEVSIGPEEGKKAFHLLFYQQLKSVEGIAWCQDHENWESTGVSAIYGNNWADTCFTRQLVSWLECLSGMRRQGSAHLTS